MTLNITGNIDEVTLVDSSGGDYPIHVSGDGKTVTFNLTTDADAIGLNAVTTDNSVQVSYKAQNVSAANPAPTKKSTAIRSSVAVSLMYCSAMIFVVVQ